MLLAQRLRRALNRLKRRLHGENGASHSPLVEIEGAPRPPREAPLGWLTLAFLLGAAGLLVLLAAWVMLNG